MIAPYVQKDPTKFCSYKEFEKGVSTLRAFCLLRAESINGQLNGVIPSTSDGQAQDTSTLIDAGELTISDMGSMGNIGGPGGMHRSPPGSQTPSGRNPEDLPSEPTPSASDKTARTVPPS